VEAAALMLSSVDWSTLPQASVPICSYRRPCEQTLRLRRCKIGSCSPQSLPRLGAHANLQLLGTNHSACVYSLLELSVESILVTTSSGLTLGCASVKHVAPSQSMPTRCPANVRVAHILGNGRRQSSGVEVLDRHKV
jgi:hypothetical protein